MSRWSVSGIAHTVPNFGIAETYSVWLILLAGRFSHIWSNRDKHVVVKKTFACVSVADCRGVQRFEHLFSNRDINVATFCQKMSGSIPVKRLALPARPRHLCRDCSTYSVWTFFLPARDNPRHTW